ncbi:MAG: ATP-binding cassette domain-containing protein [Fibromonadaceae bacterium]|jgi:ATP-binding cassette subfamily C protein|nr:ATP-binding cassette domain-containing protein [Fibromonadaceae bacterium]
MMDEFISSYKALCDYLNIDVKLPSMGIIKNLGNPTEEILYLSGLRHKEVVLPEKWWRHNGNAMLGKLKDGTPITLLPHIIWGYRIYNPKTDTVKKVDAKIASEIDENATAIYRTFPSESINLKHIVELIHGENLYKDIIIVLLCCFITSIIQVLPAIMSEEIFNTIIPENMRMMLVEIVLILIVFELVNIGFSIITNLGISRTSTKAELAVHTALCDRLLYLKMPFFNKYTAGEIFEKIKGINEIKSFFSRNLKTIIFNLFVFVEIIVLFKYCAEITPSVLLMFVGLIAIHAIACVRKYKINLKLIDAKNKAATFVHQSIQGMHRVMVSGAEERVYNIWNSLETDKHHYKNRIKKIDNILDSTCKAFRFFSTAVVYLLIMNADSISMGAFIAYISTFFILQRSTMEFLKVFDKFPELMAAYKNIKPILESSTEYSVLKSVPANFSGSIELNHVTFRYSEFGRTVLRDISFKIEEGQCVGIIGSSGSGKSTLLKLLLGFYEPTEGKIYYGGHDLETIDLRYLRKNLSTVMQDGNLTVGTIYSGIAGDNENMSAEEVLEITKSVGLDETISMLPNGLHTRLEKCKLSPGEMQKFLVAQAIAKKSKFIFLDEATSHLDNESQNKIIECIKKIPATKIIIAQRLETVRACDKIIVIEDGKIGFYH